MDFENLVTGVGVAGVLAWVVRWLLTEGKQTLDRQADVMEKLSNSLDKLTNTTELRNSKLETIEGKLDRLHDDIKDLKHEIGG